MRNKQRILNVDFKFDGNKYRVSTDILRKKLWEIDMKPIEFARLIKRKRASVSNLLCGNGSKSTPMIVTILLIGELDKICKGDLIEMENRAAQIMSHANRVPGFIREKYAVINTILRKENKADSC